MIKNLVAENVAELKATEDYQNILQMVRELSDLKVYILVRYFDRLTENEYVLQELAAIEEAVERDLIKVSRSGEITYIVPRRTLEKEEARTK